MDWLLINPSSGAGRATARLSSLRARFQEHSIVCEEKIAATFPEINDIALKAAQTHVDRLWVLGGDGTLSAAAGGLCYSSTILCPLPGGTMCVFCRELGIPPDPLEAVSSILMGEKITIDVGQIWGARSVDPGSDTKFLLLASAGIDAETVRSVNWNLKRVIGPMAYVVQGAINFFSYRAPRLTVTDEHGIDRVGYHLIVQNARLYGGSVVMAPKAKLDDGRFDVILIKKSGRLAILQFLYAIRSGDHVRLPYVDYFRSSSVNIQCADPDSIQADGDCMMKLPAKITILPKALHVLAPRPRLAA